VDDAFFGLFSKLGLLFVDLEVWVKALPRVQYRKQEHEGVVERLKQYEAKPSAVFVFRPSPSAIFSYCTSMAVLYLCF